MVGSHLESEKSHEKLEVLSIRQVSNSILLESIWKYLVKFYINELSKSELNF